MNAVVATDEYEQGILDNVREYGCHVTFVFDPDQEEPDFAYSVGFPETVGQPEVIIFGLPREVMHFVVNEVRRQCESGLELQDWTEIGDLLEGHACVVRRIPSQNIKREYFNSALWYHHERTGDVLEDAVQIVWPSAVSGLFPWEEGCHEDVRLLQPPLYSTELNS